MRYDCQFGDSPYFYLYALMYNMQDEDFAMRAFEKFGFFRGMALTVWRILRCNPWSMGGIDHVPEKFTFKVKKIDYRQLHSEADTAEEKNGNGEISSDLPV